jgi:F0F1-type ATP synthase assembly protein I
MEFFAGSHLRSQNPLHFSVELSILGAAAVADLVYSVKLVKVLMAKLLLPALRGRVVSVVLWPLVMVLGVSILLWLTVSQTAALSTAYGGLIWCAPTAIMAYYLFANVSARAGGRLLATFFIVETGKLLLVAVLIIILLKFFTISLGFLLLGYILAQAAFWIIAGRVNFFNRRENDDC